MENGARQLVSGLSSRFENASFCHRAELRKRTGVPSGSFVRSQPTLSSMSARKVGRWADANIVHEAVQDLWLGERTPLPAELEEPAELKDDECRVGVFARS